MAMKTDKLIPHTISDMGAIDEDSGLRQFRGMITPWESIKSFRETVHFLWRHSAIMGVAYMDALKIVESDYEKRQTTMSNNWAQAMRYMWSKEDPMGVVKGFEDRQDIPPFMKESLYRSACYCDIGDEFTGMPGYIWYASNDRIEKEVHQCPIDIIGPDACDLSNGGGQYFCYGCSGVGQSGNGDEGMSCYLTQRKGCGDPYCHVLHERASKYGPNKNADGHDWEMWGPGGSMPREKDQHPHKEECEWMHTGEFVSALGARWTAGEMYKQACQAPLSYAAHAAGAIRTLTKQEDVEKSKNIVNVMFETAGKCQFAEYNTRKAAREWLGVPAEVNDGRVLGAYISMIQQAKSVPWMFIEFSEERTVIEVDAFLQNYYGQYPEFTDAYLAYFNAIAKTLVDAQWIVKLGEDAPEGKIRYVIEKGLYGFRRQKPGYTYGD
ncbi:MAG: hypothetical protein EOM40_09790 [Clostridia bacterium]|nr:hypothetical protein [Clostridia bacterium]NCC44303.1 hypothetical protein [Clostridia bacterium]